MSCSCRSTFAIVDGMADTLTPEEVASARAALPALSQRLEINAGTKGLTAAPVVEALVQLTRDVEFGGYRGYQEIQAQAAHTRDRLARLIGSDPEELAFTGNASESLNFAALCLPWEQLRPSPGKPVDVLISDHEYPITNALFGYLEQTGRARLICFQLSADTQEMLASATAAATNETRLLVASHVDCNTGLRADVTALSTWCRERGIISYIDGAQATGQFPTDLHAIGCDLYITNGHKWLFGPSGVGVLYIRSGFEEQMEPPRIGAGTVRGFVPPIEWAIGARRFELTAQRPAQVYAAMGNALDWLEGFGLDRIEATQRALTAHVTARLKEMPERYRIITPSDWEKASALVTVQIPGWDGKHILEFCARLLAEDRAFLRPVPEFDGIRLSMAYYNTPEDYERFFALVDEEFG